MEQCFASPEITASVMHQSGRLTPFPTRASAGAAARKSSRSRSSTFPNHGEYWMAQAFPALLVIRNSEGEVRWMEVRDWLKRASENGMKVVKQIAFDGERFDVMSVRRWRERVLGSR